MTGVALARPLDLLHARRRAVARVRAGGLTLVEMLVVLAIVALLFAGVVMGSGQLAGAKLSKGVTTLNGLIRVAYVRATVTDKSLRIVFDLDHSTFWLEESDQPMLVQEKDATGTGGADPMTVAEKAAIAEGDRIIKGPQVPRPHFHAVKPSLYTAGDEKGTGVERSLPRGVTFRQVETPHDEAARTKGRAYLYFWPGGMTERASIVLRKGTSTEDNDAMTLLVSPLTGKVTVKSGRVSLPTINDESDLSEREDHGTP